jgi:hypothetical protein
MNCREIQERFVDFLTGDAEAAVRDEIRDHVSACAGCRDELETMTLAWTKLGVLPEQKPGPALKTRFYAMLETYKVRLEEEHEAAASRGPGHLAGRIAGWWPRTPASQLAFSVLFLVVGLLAGVLLRPGADRSAAIARLEAEVRDMRQQVSLSLLDQSSPSDRLSGLSVAAQVRNPTPRTLDALLRTLDEDPNTNVRLAAVDALYLFRGDPRVRDGLVGSLDRQTSPLVQVALINLLAEIKESRAAEALKRLIADGQLMPEVRQKAEWGLRQLI